MLNEIVQSINNVQYMYINEKYMALSFVGPLCIDNICQYEI